MTRKTYTREGFKRWLKKQGNRTPWKDGDTCPVATYMGLKGDEDSLNGPNDEAQLLDPEFANVVDCIRGGKWNKITAKEALLVCEILDSGVAEVYNI